MAYFHQIAGSVAGVIYLGSIFPYVRSIIKGKTRPNRASFGIWAVLGIILLVSYIAGGGSKEAIWPAVVDVISPLVVFLLAMKYGEGGFGRFDLFCLGGAAAGLTVWLITKNPAAALYITMVIDFFGFMPTIKKSYLDPKSEDKLGWSLASLGGTINLLTLSGWSPNLIVYPVYIFIMHTGVAALLWIRNS